MLQVSGNTLQEVKFKHLGVVFASGRWSLKIDTRISEANVVLRELYRSVGTKQELSNTRPRWSNCISDLAWSSLGVELAELSQIAVDYEVFQVLLVLLLPRPSTDEKQAWKWMKWITFTLFSLFTAVLKCLAS